MVIGTGKLVQHTADGIIAVVVHMQSGGIAARHEVERIVRCIEHCNDIVLEIGVADNVTAQRGTCHIHKLRGIHAHRVKDHLYIRPLDDIQRSRKHVGRTVEDGHQHVVGNNTIIVGSTVHVRNTDTARPLGGVHLVTSNAAAIIYILSQDSIAGVGTHIVYIVAVNQHGVLVHNADGRIRLVGERAILDNVANRADVGCRTSDIHTNRTAIECTVPYRHRVALARVDQSLSRCGNCVTVGESTILKDTIAAIVAQLNQHIATVVGIASIIKIDSVESNTMGFRHVHQHRDIAHLTLTRTAERHLSRSRGWFKGHEVGLRCAGNIRELGDAVIAGRQLNRQRSIDTAAAQHIKAILKRGEMGSRTCAYRAFAAVGAVAGGKRSEYRIVIRLVVAHTRLVVTQRNRIVNPSTDGMITHCKVLVVVQMHTHTVAGIQDTCPVIGNRRLVVDTIPEADCTQRINAIVLQPYHHRVGSDVAGRSETGINQARNSAVTHQRKVLRLIELNPRAHRCVNSALEIRSIIKYVVAVTYVSCLGVNRLLGSRCRNMLERCCLRLYTNTVVHHLHHQIRAGIEKGVLQIDHLVRPGSRHLHSKGRVIRHLHIRQRV